MKKPVKKEPVQKVLIISSCWDCCHRDKMGDVMFCRLKQKRFLSWMKRKFPRWCPLPNEEK